MKFQPTAFLLLAALACAQAGESKLLVNPFHKKKETGMQVASNPAAAKENGGKKESLDAASMYTNSLWGPNSPLLGEKNPTAMKRYKHYLRKARHKHFWQKGL